MRGGGWAGGFDARLVLRGMSTASMTRTVFWSVCTCHSDMVRR